MKKYMNPPGKIGEILFKELEKYNKVYGSLTVIAHPLPLMSLNMDKLKSAETFDNHLLQTGFVYFVVDERRGNVSGVLILKLNDKDECNVEAFIPDNFIWSSTHDIIKEILDYCEIITPFPGVYVVALRNKKEKIDSIYTSGQLAGSIDLKEYVRQLKSLGKSDNEDKSTKLIKVLRNNSKKNTFSRRKAV
jgi:hypothetical protein